MPSLVRTAMSATLRSSCFQLNLRSLRMAFSAAVRLTLSVGSSFAGPSFSKAVSPYFNARSCKWVARYLFWLFLI